MEKKTRITALLAAAFLTFGLAGCGGGTDSPAPETAPSASPSPTPTPLTIQTSTSGSWVNVARFSEPHSLDPALVDDPDSVMMCAHLYEGLMRWEDSGEEASGGQGVARLTLGQAESYKKEALKDGGVRYTFTIRKDARWSDGRAVTAQDFVTGWRRLANSRDSAAYAHILSSVVNAVEIEMGTQPYDALGVSAPDERTFVVELVEDSPEFLEYCAHPATAPMRMDVLEKYQNKEWSTQPAEWVSNGAYVLSGWESYGAIRMTRNWLYAPHLDGPNVITWHYMADEAAAQAALQDGTVDFVRRTAADSREALERAGVLGQAEHAGLYYLAYQSKAEPFDDPRVRQAFTLALDRATLAELDPAAGDPAGGFVPGGIADAGGVTGEDFRTTGGDFYSTERADYAENCKRARELLALAGYPEGEGFPKVTYLYNTGEVHQQLAEAMQEMWRTALGVEVTLQGERWDHYTSLFTEGKFSIARTSWTAEYNDPLDFLYLCAPMAAEVWYESEEFGALLDKAATAAGAERMRLAHQAEELLLGRDWAVCPLYFYADYYITAPNLTGIYRTPLGNYYFNTATRK